MPPPPDEEERRYGKPSFDVRLSLLENWQEKHDAWSAHQSDRLDSMWDWRSEVKATLRTTNRLLWAVLTALLMDLGAGVYVIVHH